ncbi:MAG: response regulator, partial [Candidatus Zixiibacteriota bacterium]
MARNKDISNGALKVLYIEDDSSQREELASQLRRRGHTILSQKSGEEGLKYLGKENADIVLCDLNMPGMNGLEVLQAIRQKGIKIPFMLITAHGSVELATQAIREGVYHFLMKPFDIDNIEILMYQALEHSELQKRLDENSRKLEKAT